jgi:flagellar basal body-associated protein FliL
MAENSNSKGLKKVFIALSVVLILLVEIGVSYVINKNVVVPKYLARQQLKAEQPVAEASAEVNDAKSNSKENDSRKKDKKKEKESADTEESSPAELNQNIYMLNDLVINPAASNGSRYVAMSIGLGVTEEKALEELQNREIQVRDAVNMLLSQKTLGKFIDIKERGALKQEILETINDKMVDYKVESIYFTEYVIQ